MIGTPKIGKQEGGRQTEGREEEAEWRVFLR